MSMLNTKSYAIIQEKETTEIKKGDWVYWSKPNPKEEGVFLVEEVRSGFILDRDDMNVICERYCTKLEPLESFDGLEEGDRLAKIDGQYAGNICRIKSTRHRDRIFVTNFKMGSSCIAKVWAKLPDRKEPEKPQEIPDQNIMTYGLFGGPINHHPHVNWIVDDEIVTPPPQPCPHPEWLGVWDRQAYSRATATVVTWDDYQFVRTDYLPNGEQHIESCPDWGGPMPHWNQIELASPETTDEWKPASKRIKTPLDPYDGGY